jgi:hypothetical protein
MTVCACGRGCGGVGVLHAKRAFEFLSGAQPTPSCPIPVCSGHVPVTPPTVMLPILYTATVMPFEIFFVDDPNTPGWIAADVIITIFFFLDMVGCVLPALSCVAFWRVCMAVSFLAYVCGSE